MQLKKFLMTNPNLPSLIFLLVRRLKERSTSELKLLKKKLNPVGSRPGILYGLGKIPRKTCNGLPSFHPILSVIGTPTNKLAKFLLKFLTPSTDNEYTVINLCHFTEEICQQDHN